MEMSVDGNHFENAKRLQAAHTWELESTLKMEFDGILKYLKIVLMFESIHGVNYS
jgi:hypothetical protein